MGVRKPAPGRATLFHHAAARWFAGFVACVWFAAFVVWFHRATTAARRCLVSSFPRFLRLYAIGSDWCALCSPGHDVSAFSTFLHMSVCNCLRRVRSPGSRFERNFRCLLAVGSGGCACDPGLCALRCFCVCLQAAPPGVHCAAPGGG